jgi:hypothetical protein
MSILHFIRQPSDMPALYIYCCPHGIEFFVIFLFIFIAVMVTLMSNN